MNRQELIDAMAAKDCWRSTTGRTSARALNSAILPERKRQVRGIGKREASSAVGRGSDGRSRGRFFGETLCNGTFEELGSIVGVDAEAQERAIRERSA